MRVTSAVKSKIQLGMDAKGWNNTQLAEAINKDRSWVSKLLAKKSPIAALKPDLVDSLNDVLEIDLYPLRNAADDDVLPVARSLSKLANGDTEAEEVLNSLAALLAKPEGPYIPDFHQKDLIKIGAAVTKIVHQWEDAKDPHYAKIGAETLTCIRKMFDRMR